MYRHVAFLIGDVFNSFNTYVSHKQENAAMLRKKMSWVFLYYKYMYICIYVILLQNVRSTPGGGGGRVIRVSGGICIGSAEKNPPFQPPWYDKSPPPLLQHIWHKIMHFWRLIHVLCSCGYLPGGISLEKHYHKIQPECCRVLTDISSLNVES